jgi:hypothetical protein
LRDLRRDLQEMQANEGPAVDAVVETASGELA